MSLLVRQLAYLKGGFTQQHPNSWVVWEPGGWTAAQGPQPQKAETLMPAVGFKMGAGGGDALCFELGAAAAGKKARIGRADENDLVVNDATVSREHVVLSAVAEGQWFAASKGDKPALLNGKVLSATAPVSLKDQDTIQLGNARLTFHDSAGFEARLKVELDKHGTR